MEPGRVFVSYSRRQFHAAQQLVTALSEDGFDVWLDVERLVPGADWNAAIDQAIDEASAFVLVASPQAAASQHVAREWRRAQADGIPVYVALVRGARLPAELAGLPRVDLRRRFDRGAGRLTAALRGAGIPAPHRWTVWPPTVLLIAVALGLNSLAVAGLLAVAAIDLDDPVRESLRPAAVVMAAVGIIYAAWILQPLRAFCAGRARLFSIALPLSATVPLLFIMWGVLGALISVVNHGGTFINERAISGDLTEPYLLVLPLVLLVDTGALIALFRSRAVLRRMPPGEGPRKLLARTATRRPAATAPAVAVDSITVHFAPPDAVIAEQITSAFRWAGVPPVTTGGDLHLVVISNATTWAAAAGHLRSGRSIAVLACGVRLPDEAEDLRRVQWVDFRDGHTGRLRELAASLTRPGEPAATPAIPRAADVFDAPRAAKVVLECLVAAAAVFALSAGFTAGIAPPREARVHTTEPLIVPGPVVRPTPTGWRPLLDCDQPVLPASPGILPMPVCRYVAPTYDPILPRRQWVANPDYPKLPDTADTILRVRAGLAVALAVLALGLAYGIGRRVLRRGSFAMGMLAVFALAGVWIVLGLDELSPVRMGEYVVLWFVAAIRLSRSASSVTEWLPGDEPLDRHHLIAAGAGLLRPTLPAALLLLGVWYGGGIVL